MSENSAGLKVIDWISVTMIACLGNTSVMDVNVLDWHLEGNQFYNN
jgi:hypothetical protein